MWMRILIHPICRLLSGDSAIIWTQNATPFYLKAGEEIRWSPLWGLTVLQKRLHLIISTGTGPISLLLMRKQLKQLIKNGVHLVLANLFPHLLCHSETNYMVKKPLRLFNMNQYWQKIPLLSFVYILSYNRKVRNDKRIFGLGWDRLIF